MPFKNTTGIPRGLVEHLDGAVKAGMTCWVRLSHPGGLMVRDDVAGVTRPSLPVPYYEGPARIQSRAGASPTDAAARMVTVGDYLFAVPVDAGVPLLNDLGDVLESPDDLMLIGRTLIVAQVPMASIVLQRNLGANLQTATNP